MYMHVILAVWRTHRLHPRIATLGTPTLTWPLRWGRSRISRWPFVWLVSNWIYLCIYMYIYACVCTNMLYIYVITIYLIYIYIDVWIWNPKDLLEVLTHTGGSPCHHANKGNVQAALPIFIAMAISMIYDISPSKGPYLEAEASTQWGVLLQTIG